MKIFFIILIRDIKKIKFIIKFIKLSDHLELFIYTILKMTITDLF